jgi:HPt (histidine-containing phosphotransfer) domain-containing protein
MVFLEASKVIVPEVKEAMFEMLARDLRASLQKVSEKAAMIELIDEFEEKMEEEKQTLESALLELDTLPYLVSG